MNAVPPPGAAVPQRALVDWALVDDLLLDMDGTLLDLRYDNDFWFEHLPTRYARHRGIERSAAQQMIQARSRATARTIAFYCLDDWSRYLGVDVAALNEELAHLIALRPGVAAFLDAVGALGKRRVLVTNSHPRGLAFKLARTGLDRLLDVVVSAHEYGAPKEHRDFWSSLQAHQGVVPARSLMIDDNPQVLGRARACGVGQLLAVTKPDSRRPEVLNPGFPPLRDFSEILP